MIEVEGRIEFVGRRLILCAFIASLIWAVAMATVGWNNTLSDEHGFRQTQTAITSYYLLHGGPFFRYETPVLGRPWSIPFEFPLYQWIVASVSGLLDTPLNQTGRFVSEIFFCLSLLMLWFWLTDLKVRSVHRLVFLTLVLVSPLYVFWSRSFMIESTALFFSMAYLFFICRHALDRSAYALILGGLSGVLGFLTKTTTMPAFVTVACLFYFWISRQQKQRLQMIIWRNWLPLVFFIVVPFLSAFAWIHYTDQVKSLNVVAAATETSDKLQQWNFGWTRQRLALDTWKIVSGRILPDVAGSNLILLLPLVGIAVARNRLFPFLASIAGFLSVFLVFTNLHVVHNYYQYSNGIFLIMASSWCIIALLEQQKFRHLLGIIIFFGILFTSVTGYYDRFFSKQKTNHSELIPLANVIKRIIPPDQIMLVFGEDWSSELPYYSERRALMCPKQLRSDVNSFEMNEALHRLGNTRIGVLLICNQWRKQSKLIQRATDKLKFPDSPVYQDAVCSVYSPL